MKLISGLKTRFENQVQTRKWKTRKWEAEFQVYFKKSEKISIDSNESPVRFDIKLTSIKPYNESEYKYLFSYSGISLELKRSTPGLLFGGFYFPTGIFALLSLVSFSIDLQMVPGRLGLLVTLYLIMTNVYISVEGPKSRGFRCGVFGFCLLSFPQNERKI